MAFLFVEGIAPKVFVGRSQFWKTQPSFVKLSRNCIRTFHSLKSLVRPDIPFAFRDLIAVNQRLKVL